MGSPTTVCDVRFEHYRPGDSIGIQEVRPRISFRFSDAPKGFEQDYYEIELSRTSIGGGHEQQIAKFTSAESYLLPWPSDVPLSSKERCAVRVRAKCVGQDVPITPWSQVVHVEVGLLNKGDWTAKFITAPWSAEAVNEPQPEDLFRKEFSLTHDNVYSARLYISAQGAYEAELNGRKIGDHFLAPGWTSYHGRLAYQTFDVTDLIDRQECCLGVRVAEGWFKGRLGFAGGRRNIWGSRTSLIAQLEIHFVSGEHLTVVTDETWQTIQGPIRKAEIYDGEKYDATFEVDGWSTYGLQTDNWICAEVLADTKACLIASTAEPVRRIESLKPVQLVETRSGKKILDFGQNLVGYVRVKSVKGPRGSSVIMSHAEVLEDGELGIRPLRVCEAQDIYTLRGGNLAETFEPRFTFHGFRFCQVDGWPSDDFSLDNFEAVVCHTDMEYRGKFSCSNSQLNKLYENIVWGMRGNFLSVPTDCPQRDERLGWTGDLALFAPTAAYIFGCSGIIINWLQDLWYDQLQLGGVPPMVSPNALLGDTSWRKPCAIWHDVTILAPWALWEATGDSTILARQYDSMKAWINVIPRDHGRHRHLWDPTLFQLADWLDPNAPSDMPQKATTDPLLVANAFLVHCLDLMGQIALILNNQVDASHFLQEAGEARKEFASNYITSSGRLVSDSQTAYALAICFNLVASDQRSHAGARLAELIRYNNFKVGTGFAGTPFVCEALYQTGHIDVAYGMTLCAECPSWLYPVTMGATTVWERWDSMLPDGSINPGEMTSFNHYAYGAIAKFLVTRLAGLQCLEPGWKRTRAEPVIEGDFMEAKAEHLSPYGKVSVSWRLSECGGDRFQLMIDVVVPPTTQMEVVLPGLQDPEIKIVESGEWSFTTVYKRRCHWPVSPLSYDMP